MIANLEKVVFRFEEAFWRDPEQPKQGTLVKARSTARQGYQIGKLVALVVLAVIAALFADSAPALTTVMLAFGTLGFSAAGMQNVLYTLAAHLYSTSARATGIGAALSVGRLGAVVSSFTGAWSLDFGGGTAFFVVIAIGFGIAAIAGVSVRRPIRAVHMIQ